MPVTWLALAYQVPTEPSRARVYVWRKLREHGAVYLKQGVALLPKSPPSLTKFRSLALKIQEMGGEATLAELRFVDVRDEAETIERFRSQSQSEYRELIAELAKMRESLRQDRAREARADDARRMARRYGQVRARDYFKSRTAPDISSDLDELIGDMSRATDDLLRHFAQMLLEKEQ